jgi:hypothetical protein
MSYKSGTSAPVVLVLFSSLVNALFASQGSTLCLRFCDPEACMHGSSGGVRDEVLGIHFQPVYSFCQKFSCICQIFL